MSESESGQLLVNIILILLRKWSEKLWNFMRKNVWCEGVVYDVLGGVVGGMAGNISNTCAYHHYLHMMKTQIKSNLVLDSKIISV